MKDMIGTALGKYSLVASLGMGGMATVYTAHQPSLDRYVAVKVLHPHLAQDPEFVLRFEREAAAVARLNHPGVVKIYDFDADDGWYFMVMELIHGPTLKAEMRTRIHAQQRFLPGEIVKIGAALASAIDYAHAHNVIHRDIKPSNVMLTEEGQVVLTDFGLAYIVGGSQLTDTGSTSGTPDYTSPEQALGKRGDRWSDIYSLGVVLYEMATGCLPFHGETTFATLMSHVSSQPVPPSHYNPDLPAALEDVILTAMQKAPGDRYQSGKEMAKALLDSLDSSRVGVTPIPLLAPIPDVEGLGEDDTSTGGTRPLRPYRGLFPFREEDAPFFFGREAFVGRLVDVVHRHAMVAVVGPSGNGKSSVVMAGLLPRLREEANWTLVHFRPGNHPLQALSEALLPLLAPNIGEVDRLVEARKMAQAFRSEELLLSDVVERILKKETTPSSTEGDRAQRFLLVADQFEELYTLCSEPEERQRLPSVLLEAVRSKASECPRFVLALTLRADFMAQVLAHRGLANALQTADVKLGPMTDEELREAIEQPAAQVGVTFEPGLVERILDDVGDEPGNLPLLEFALNLMWDRRAGGRLTHAAYEAIGRVEGALARYAEKVYAGLSEEERGRVRHILTQLVHPGEGTEDTRRLATRAELGEEDWALVRRLADERLVVTGQDPTGQDTVEVVHEALIRGWHRLREWMDTERDFRSWQERLRAAARQWETREHDEAVLLRGRVLAEAEEWLLTRRASLGETEKAFVEAGIGLREQHAAEQEAQRQRELEAARRLAEAERQRAEEQTAAARKLRSRAWLLAGALVVAALLALLAFTFAQQSVRNEKLAESQRAIAVENADLAESQRQEAEVQRGIALDKEQVAAQNAALAEEQREEAERQREVAVENAALAEEQRQEAERQRQIAVENAALAEEQRQIAVSRQIAAQSRTLLDKQYDLALLLGVEANNLRDTAETRSSLLAGLEHQPHLLTILHGNTGMVQWVAFSPDGQLLASVGANGMVQLWRIEREGGTVVARADGTPLAGHDPAQLVNCVDFAPDGSWMATASDDGTIKIWDVAGRALLQTLDESGDYVQTLAVSPDGTTLAAGGGHGFVGLWDTDTWQLARTLEGHKSDVWQLAFSPDGQTLATSSSDSTAILWDVPSGEPRLAPLVFPIWAQWLAFSPDGQALATRDCSETDAGGWCLRDRVALWDTATGTVTHELNNGEEGMIASVIFYGPNGEFLLTRGASGEFTQWDRASGELIANLFTGRPGALWAMDVSPDGQFLASANLDGTVEVWDLSDELWLETAPSIRFSGGVAGLAYSPGGEWFAAGGEDGQIIFVDSSTGEPVSPATPGAPLIHASPTLPAVSALALHPTEGRLIATYADGTLHEWVPGEGEGFVDNGSLRNTHTHGAVSLAMSVEGTWMATGTADGRVYVWDAAQNRAVLVRTRHRGPVSRLVFAPDVDGTGPALISGGQDGQLVFWVPGLDPRLSLHAHQGAVNSLAASDDAQWVASGSDQGEIALWSLESGELRWRVPDAHAGPVLALAFEAGAPGTRGSAGSLVSIGADGQIRRWGLDAGVEPTRLLDVGSGQEWRAAVLSGRSLVLGSANGEVQVWNLAGTPALIAQRDTGGGAITALAYNGTWLFAGGEEGALSGWDLAASAPHPGEAPVSGADTAHDLALAESRPLAIATLALDPTGEALLSVSTNGLALLWDVNTGEPRVLSLSDDALSTFSAVFHPNGRLVAVARCDGRDAGENDYCNQGDIVIWDLESDRVQARLTTEAWPALHLAFSPDGQYLASGGCALADVAGNCIQGQAIVWDLASGEPLHAPFKAHSRQVSYVAFSPDSRLLAAASLDKTVTLWNVASGEPVGQRLVGHDYYALSAAFAPDGTTLATGGVRAVPGGFEGELILWDVATGQRLGDPLYAHAYGMRHLAYRPDGRQIVSGSYDGTLALWDVDLDSWQARACRVANRNLTAEEWTQFFGDTAYLETCP